MYEEEISYCERGVENAVGGVGLVLVVVLLRHDEGARDDEDEAGVAVRVLRHDHLPRKQRADLDPEEKDEEEVPNRNPVHCTNPEGELLPRKLYKYNYSDICII